MYRELVLRLTKQGLYEFTFDKGGELPQDLSGKYTRAEEGMTAAAVHLAKNPKKGYVFKGIKE